MTDKDIERLAREYAELNPPSTQDEILREAGIKLNTEMVFGPFLQWLAKTHCIVPKSEVWAKYYENIKNIKHNASQGYDDYVYSYRNDMLTELFGTELFEETDEVALPCKERREE